MDPAQTPQKNPPQSGRKSSKHHKAQPRSETQRTVQSDNDAYQSVAQEGEHTPSRKNRKPRKKSNAKRNGVQSDIGETGESHAPRPNNQAQRAKATPVKGLQDQAYAGATFHQSPAPSALPMPSFYSKSVPSNAPISAIADTTDGTFEDKQEDKEDAEEKREDTPLEALFNAARQPRATPKDGSPARLYSPQSNSPAPRSLNVRDGDVDFPFELDGVDEPRSTTSTPFSQRLAASKTPKSTSEGGVTLTNEERQAKTAALKKALMPPADNSAQLGPAFNDNNPFNARNITPPNTQWNLSNANMASYQNSYSGGQATQHFQIAPNPPARNFSPYNTGRPASSNLRHVYSPSANPMSPPSTAPDRSSSVARSPPPQRQLNFEAIYGAAPRPQNQGNSMGHSAKPSLEQGLDDLKKALNMNFSSFA